MSRAPPVTSATLSLRSACILDSLDGVVADPLVRLPAEHDPMAGALRGRAVAGHDQPAKPTLPRYFNGGRLGVVAEHAHLLQPPARLLRALLRLAEVAVRLDHGGEDVLARPTADDHERLDDEVEVGVVRAGAAEQDLRPGGRGGGEGVVPVPVQPRQASGLVGGPRRLLPDVLIAEAAPERLPAGRVRPVLDVRADELPAEVDRVVVRVLRGAGEPVEIDDDWMGEAR